MLVDLLNLINNLKHANISPLLETCKALHVTLCTFRISIYKRASKFAKPQDLANFQRKYQQTTKPQDLGQTSAESILFRLAILSPSNQL